MSDATMEKIISLAKRRGFIFPGSEIYGGLSGTWDYGPMGIALKRNIQNLWWNMFVESRDDMFGIDAAIIMNPKAWEASGHVSGFSDPMVECTKCKKRFRADHVEGSVCPECGGKLGEARQFNMMFKTQIGATADAAATVYLRPETAGGMFVNFKNVIDSIHPKLPFGLGQIGKAFRNEIAARDFIFRVRELEQMEIEYFVHPSEWEGKFEEWRLAMHEWMKAVGIDASKVSELEVSAEDRAHYSSRTIDFEFEYPFGKKELYGLAYRADFDLKAHAEHSGVDLSVMDEDAKEKFVPHVIEPTFGVERTVLAVLLSAYTEDGMGENGRVFLKLDKKIAPVKAAVFPLLKNKPELVSKAREVYLMLKKEIPNIMWDDNGNVGKRYRRQDEIGTPHTITIDFDTLGESGDEKKDTVTVRDRDTGEQVRIAIPDLVAHIR
ncbi:MAG: glycine--tRNA ligase [Minisyncoccia bacterium]